METPPSIRQQYASPPRESPEERRRRLTNRRAAKYRHFRSLASAQSDSNAAIELQRQQNTRRQRERRLLLDDEARDRLRAQNRQRQQLRRQSLSERAKAEIRAKQRVRQRERRQMLDTNALEELRERERLRIRRRRRQQLNETRRQQQIEEETDLLPAQLQLQLTHPPVADQERRQLRLAPELPTLRQHQEQQRQIQNRLPFGGGVQITLPPPPPRTFQHPPLPHLQQVTRPSTSSLLHSTPPPLFPIPGPLSTSNGGPVGSTSAALPTVASAVAVAATRPPHPTPIMPSVSLPLPAKPLTALPMVPQQQPPRTPIVLPPAHRSLPPLPDFLNSREAFNPATAAAAAASTRTSRLSSSASRALFPSITDLPATLTDAQEADSYFQR
ncbi:hypothetical protein DVH05_008114 [Phytophthora capsici]|nr:hypothetical protein DVH05_008114 [Phytophthora capsici]